MTSLGTVFVDVKMDQQQVKAEAAKAGRTVSDGLAVDAAASGQKTVRTFGKSAQKEAESQATQIRERLMRGFEFGAAFYGAESLFSGVKHSIESAVESADQLKESSEKADRVFGESSASVLKFGQSAAASYGLSASAADQMSVKLGALLVNLKLPQAEAAKMSVQLIKLAADLAAFNHTDTASAEQALQSALAGRTQSLKQYGIVVDSVSVQQQALKDGLIHTVKDALDPAAKAQATYEVILQRSQIQQGAFARGSGSLNEQVKILQAEATNASAAIGAKLIPVLVDGAKSLQVIGHASADVVGFFEHNRAAAILLAGTLTATAIPAIIKMGIAVQALAAEGLETLALKALYAGDAISAAFAANPELFALVAAATAAGAAIELFGSKESSAKVNVDSLTQAVKDQANGLGGSVQNNILDQFTQDKIGSRGENVLQYLQRYKVDVAALVDEIARGDKIDLSLIAPVLADKSVSGPTATKLVKFLADLSIGVTGAMNVEKQLAKEHQDTIDKLANTPQGRFLEYLGSVAKAQGELTASAKTNNQTISGQIDLLKQYSAQANITADSIQKALLANIKTLAGEGNNLQTLASNGVSGDFIKQLVKEGPEYVAAVASASKQVQLQLSQQFAAGQTQLVHTDAEAARAELPAAAKTVADAAAFQAAAEKSALQAKFFDAVHSAVVQAQSIAAQGGEDTTGAFGKHADAGKQAVLTHMLNALPDPVKQAVEAALGIATTGGSQLPQNLASAINKHRPLAEQAAELLRAAIQERIDLLHDKTIDVNVRDEATAQLNSISQAISGVANAVSNFNIWGTHAPMQGPVVPGGHRAEGGPIAGPGGPKDDLVPIWGSNGEWVVDAASTTANRGVLEYLKANPGTKLPGFADGGLIQASGIVNGNLWRLLLDSTRASQSVAGLFTGSGPYAGLLSGASGGASGATSSGAAVNIGKTLAATLYGWVGSEFDALNKLWTRESGWNADAVNPSSGAYGIPQSLGHGHPYNLGDAQSQILWGLDYIKGRYGDPIAAWSHEVSAGWYDHGGILPPGGIGVNTSGKPEMVRSKTQEDAIIRELVQLQKITASVADRLGDRLNGTARSARLYRRTST